jgi:hypothetical protein
MICQWDSKFASLLCLWFIFERFPCSICGLSYDLLDGSFPDSGHSVTGAGYATRFGVDYAMQSYDYHPSTPAPDPISFSKDLTHFISHFLATRYRPVNRFRNNRIYSSITGWGQCKKQPESLHNRLFGPFSTLYPILFCSDTILRREARIKLPQPAFESRGFFRSAALSTFWADSKNKAI